jgi:GNAT superfamily N-acetyltransferase
MPEIEALDAAMFEGCVAPGASIVWWVVRDFPGKVSGYAGARVLNPLTIYLERAGVCRWARGQGLQKRLIYTRLRYGRVQGCRWAITYTIANPASVNNLIHCGFRSYAPESPWVDGDDVQYWRIKL